MTFGLKIGATVYFSGLSFSPVATPKLSKVVNRALTSLRTGFTKMTTLFYLMVNRLLRLLLTLPILYLLQAPRDAFQLRNLQRHVFKVQ
jgi:hypothetical protein